jgi:hypothetical protein
MQIKGAEKKKKERTEDIYTIPEAQMPTTTPKNPP